MKIVTNIFVSMWYITIVISFDFEVFFSVKGQHFAERHRVELWKYFHLSETKDVIYWKYIYFISSLIFNSFF